MKSFKLLNTIGIAAMTLLMTASCESGNKEFGYDGETAVYFANAGYVRTVELGEDQEVDLTDDNNHIINIKAYCAGGYGNDNNVTVDYISDASLCDGYKINGAAIQMMPSTYYEIENPNQFVIAKGQQMGGVRVKLNEKFFNDDKSYEQGYVIPVKLTKAQGVDKVLESKNTTFCLVKYVNPWTATYLRKGKDVSNGKESHRAYPYIEKAEVIKVVTKGLYKAQMTVEVKDASGKSHQVNVLMTFNGDDCSISSGSEGVQVSGSGKFVKNDQLMGEFKRNTLYLNYNIKSDALGTVETTDTMVVRNRGIGFQTFTPER